MVCNTVTRFACAAAFLVNPWLIGHAYSQTLTMRDALVRALAANPRLTAAERDVGIATGLKVQAGAVPNPNLSFELDNALGSGPFKGLQSAETTLQLSQLIELGGKRKPADPARIASRKERLHQIDAGASTAISARCSAEESTGR